MTATGVGTSGALERRLRSRRDAGRKLVVPYVTGGLPDWLLAVEAAVAAGADAVEVGIPFSDPIMDGPVVQAASARALELGATPAGVLRALAGAEVGAPLAVMTYCNLVHHAGWDGFARSLADAGVAAAIVPDLPLDEAGPWCGAADAAGVETVLLAAPTTPDDRLAAICARARGFVYAVGLMGVTGERDELAASAIEMARRAKAHTDRPVLVGVGVSTPEQAAAICEAADGVIVGSAVVRRLLEGAGPGGVADFVSDLRRALDPA